jgi:hypothetical protein
LEVARGAGPVEAAALAAQLADLRLPPDARALLAASVGSPGSPGSSDSSDSPGSWKEGDDGSVESLVTRRASAQLAALSFALAGPAFDEARLGEACGELLGLGAGQTPTGDDLLVGAAAACVRLVAAGWLEGARWESFARLLERLDGRKTTPVSREMIRWAATGMFAEPLARFVERLGDPGPAGDRSSRCAEALLQMGGRSGTDLMCGVVATTRSIFERGSEKQEMMEVNG